jgi:LPXTG-site transpeptidase (sortase) family protein
VSSHASSHRKTVEEYGGPARWPVVLLGVLLAAVLVLPWVVPAIPRTLTGLLPDGRDQAPVGAPELTPHVDPPSTPFLVSRRPAPKIVAPKALPAAGKPRSLRVDRLSVRSEVVPISGESGVLLPPSDATVLGWWREGAVPGAARGTAAMTGHTVSTGGGAFDNLRRLVAGDRVVVRTSKGTIPYVVRSTRIYGTAALARNSRKIFRLDGPGRLVLITCSDYNGEVYLTNTVVTAVPVVRSSQPGGDDRAPAG